MSEDPTSADAVARSMGLGADLPPASISVRPAGTGLEVRVADHGRPFGRTAFN